MSADDDEALAAAKEGAFREIAALDDAYRRRLIADEDWHRGMAAIVGPAYLAAATPQGGSGHGGSADDWEHSRGIVAEGLDRDGSFLDVGCANGLLMESAARWGRQKGLAIEPHGLEIVPELAVLARRRLPHWASRIHTGNALGWQPPQRYDFVRTGLEYVPAPRRRELVAWLLERVVAPGGRLIIGKHNEERDRPEHQPQLEAWGFAANGRAERPHRTHPQLVYRVLWRDAPPLHDGVLGLRSLQRGDLTLLWRWLARPHVARFFREPADAVAVGARYAPRISGLSPTFMYVIEHAGRPVGFLQWFRWRDYPEHAARVGAPADSAGLDLALGEPELLGQGLGPRALRLAVERLIFADPEIASCVVDPEQGNPRSLRAFEKAGFARAHAIEDGAALRQIMRRLRAR